MRAIDVMTVNVITATLTRRCRRWPSCFPNGASAGSPLSTPPIGWSASSARVTFCIVSKPGLSADLNV